MPIVDIVFGSSALQLTSGAFVVGGIFISYRRDDSAPWAGRLYERLSREFPRDQLLMDVDAIEPGLDFVNVITDQIAGCDVVLAIIGPNWASAQDKEGRRRLDDPKDFVHLELSSALSRDIRVIPVLIDGAEMPNMEDLPEPLRPLARRNAIQIGHVRFGADTKSLVDTLRRLMPQPEPTSRRHMIMAASIFAIGSVPLTMAMGGLFETMQWGFFGANPVYQNISQKFAGQAAGAIVVVVVAMIIGKFAQKFISGTEIALYWLGASVAGQWGLFSLFNALRWKSFAGVGFPDPGVSGRAVGAILALSALSFLVLWRRATMGGTEIALYWLGSSIVVLLGLMDLFDSGRLAGAALALASASTLIMFRRSAVTRAELALYWLGSSVVLLSSLPALFAEKSWVWTTTGVSWIGGNDGFVSGFWTCVILAVTTGMALLWIHWRQHLGSK